MGPSFSEVASFAGRSENALLKCICTRATLLHFMPDPNQKRTNSALWLGLLITVLGPLSNFLYYYKIPAAVLPWLNLAIPAIGLLLILIGVVRASRQPQLYRGKILGSIFTVLAALLFAGSVWLFIHVRDVPRSAGAPQIGQRVPDFTCPTVPTSLSLLPNCFPPRREWLSPKPCFSFSIVDIGDPSATSSYEASRKIFPSLPHKASGPWPSA
jgi:hypothetical protein